MMMTVSAAEDVKNNLTGLVGGNVTFPASVKELAFILKERQNIALVNKEEFTIYEEIYEKKLLWDRNSGLFTLTDLQTNNSGIYTIDSKKGEVPTLSYVLTVYGEFLLITDYKTDFNNLLKSVCTEGKTCSSRT